jgi:hypothetical protein
VEAAVIQKPPYQRSCISTSHQILILKLFSSGDMLQPVGSRLSPNALDNATAIPTMPPFPNIEVLGLPLTLMSIAIIDESPGDRNNSE